MMLICTLNFLMFPNIYFSISDEIYRFVILSDSSHQIKRQADSAVYEFLQEIKNSLVVAVLIYELLPTNPDILYRASYLNEPSVLSQSSIRIFARHNI
ncbi:hypothetical protein CDL12_01358 [Handroanthus impetiginosus]|uniref:Uncharacterized protein n=1 Tax=Handroanthus impetiginosus TaxID=429701 RepID=A0A2G9I8D5_9LAMI|nr:hypothetical protein CDL12_01358 [Handroanthus impetiginosus]